MANAPNGPERNKLPRSFVDLSTFLENDLPDAEGWAVELVQLCTHKGTHLDAPYHFHSTMDQALGEKKPAIAIHEVPLEWCFQPGVKLDFRDFADGYVVTAADVEAELKRIGHTIAPLEIVVVNTRAGARDGSPDYGASGGFYISCFPNKVRGASAGWTHAVAIFDDKLMAA